MSIKLAVPGQLDEHELDDLIDSIADHIRKLVGTEWEISTRPRED